MKVEGNEARILAALASHLGPDGESECPSAKISTSLTSMTSTLWNAGDGKRITADGFRNIVRMVVNGEAAEYVPETSPGTLLSLAEEVAERCMAITETEGVPPSDEVYARAVAEVAPRFAVAEAPSRVSKAGLWEAAGTYPQACRMLATMAAGPSRHHPPKSTQVLASSWLGRMREAHVVTCAREQVEALPVLLSLSDLRTYAQHLRPPFPKTYLSLGGVEMAGEDPIRWRMSDVSHGESQSGRHGSLLGVYLDQSESGDAWWAAPLFDFDPASGHAHQLHSWASTGHVTLDPALDPEIAGAEGLGRVAAVWTAVERAVAVLVLLDNTVGVELREKDQREVSRQVRRSAERRGAQLAWTVAITVPKRSHAAARVENKANYSHRYERSAHFACVTKGKHVQDVSKLSAWCPRHGVKACRREWKRATIVGPAHLPLIPKVRRVRGTVEP